LAWIRGKKGEKGREIQNPERKGKKGKPIQKKRERKKRDPTSLRPRRDSGEPKVISNEGKTEKGVSINFFAYA